MKGQECGCAWDSNKDFKHFFQDNFQLVFYSLISWLVNIAVLTKTFIKCNCSVSLYFKAVFMSLFCVLLTLSWQTTGCCHTLGHIQMSFMKQSSCAWCHGLHVDTTWYVHEYSLHCMCADWESLILLWNIFAQLTRDKLGMEQSSMWFQYKHRLQVLGQSWVASFQRHVNMTESRSH